MTLEELVAKCKADVSVSFNSHLGNYLTIEQEITDCGASEDIIKEIGEERFNRLIKGDQLVRLQWYPHTPIGFHYVYGATLQECLEQAGEIEREK